MTEAKKRTMIHCRVHEVGPQKPRTRIWTDEMENYGQFNVVSFDDVVRLKEMHDKLGLSGFKVHCCDSREDCNATRCLELSYGEDIGKILRRD